jgi:hypothetical protein
MDPPELLSGKQCYSSRGLRYCRSPGYDGASSLAWIPKTDGIAFTFPRLDINATFPLCSLIMATAHASARGQRTAILASPLRELTGFCLAVDCLTAGCRGERVYSITALAACYDGNATVGDALRQMRCAGCGKPVGAAWLVTGPTAQRARPAAPGGTPGTGVTGVSVTVRRRGRLPQTQEFDIYEKYLADSVWTVQPGRS